MNWKKDIRELRRWIAISESKKFIYFKPARTAGTSILRFKLAKEVDGLLIGKDKPQRFENWIQKTKRLTPYFKFTIIRNPLDRFVSIFHMYNKYTKGTILSFEVMIKDRLYTKNPVLIDHCIPMYKFTQYADYVGRYEDLKKHWWTIAEKIGVTKGLRHESKTQAKRKMFITYYDNEMIDILKKDFPKDFELYGI